MELALLGPLDPLELMDPKAKQETLDRLVLMGPKVKLAALDPLDP